MKKTLLSLLLIGSTSAAFAQWTQLPGEGGEVKDLTLVPGGILVATDGGVFKSVNGGINWTYSSNGLFAADSSLSVRQFASTSTALFAQTDRGIAKTTDNGSTWVSAGNVGLTSMNSGNYTSLVSVGNKLYTCRYSTSNTYQIFTSINDGANWTAGANVYSTSDNPRLFSIGGTVYVSKEDSMFTTATGASLAAMSYTGFPVTGNAIGNLSGDGTYLYAGYNNGGGGFLRYDIANSTWQSMTTGIPAFAFSAGPYLVNNTLYASVLTMSMTLQTYTSSTQGSTWTQTTLTGMNKDFVQSIFSLGGSDLLVYNPVDELNISNNNGLTWTQHTTGFKAETFRDSRSLTFSNGNLVSSKDLGIVTSSNGGATWLPSTVGLPASIFFNYTLYNANNTLYTNFKDISGSYLYKSTNGAVSWTAATMPSGVYDMEFWGHSNTAIFVKDGNTIYHSVNGGTSWVDITTNLPGGYNYPTPIVSNGTTCYIVGTSGSGDQIWYSTDDGVSWNPVTMSGTPASVGGYIADNVFINNGSLMSFWLDASVFPYTYKMCTFVGSNWNSVNTTGLPPNLISTCSMCGNNGTYATDWFTNASYIYYMTDHGLFMSSDNGASFNQYNNGFYPGVAVSRLTTDGVSLYAGTEGNSIWKITNPTGLNSYTKSESVLDVYPNPAANHVTVSYSKDVVDATSKLTIVDMLGSTVQEVNLPMGSTKVEISTSNFKSGVYFYMISSDTKKSVAKKLVISK